jgi:hypothetical protein
MTVTDTYWKQVAVTEIKPVNYRNSHSLGLADSQASLSVQEDLLRINKQMKGALIVFRTYRHVGIDLCLLLV